MKLNSRMPLNLLACGLLALIYGEAALGANGATAADDAVVSSPAGIPYVSGGVGTESIERLNANARNFNLKLVFSTKSGEFLSGVKVGIADAAGKSVVAAVADGPWFLVKLPSGTYQVTASFEGKTIVRQRIVDNSTFTTMDFQWDSR